MNISSIISETSVRHLELWHPSSRGGRLLFTYLCFHLTTCLCLLGFKDELPFLLSTAHSFFKKRTKLAQNTSENKKQMKYIYYYTCHS